MRQYILTQWKEHRGTVALIILGFFVANLIMSVGITMSKHTIETYQDNLIGNPEEQVTVFFDAHDSKKLWSDLDFLKGAGEIQLLSQDNVSVEKGKTVTKCQPVPVWFERQEDWHIPIISGRYLLTEDIKNRSQVVVLGKDVARKLGAETGDTIKIEKQDYKVIGIAGRTYRETIWDYVMYLPLETFCNKNQPFISDNQNISILLKSGKDKFMKHYAERKDIKYEEVEEEIDTSGIRNAILLTIIVSGSVFIIAVVNITNLMLYWIMERRKAYGIMKAIGGHNGYILKIVFVEVLMFTIISSMLALVFQEMAHILAPLLPLELSPINIVIAITVAFLTGGMAAFVPARRAMKLQPIKILNEGDL